jgi:hypothetical protein
MTAAPGPWGVVAAGASAAMAATIGCSKRICNGLSVGHDGFL